MQMSDEQERNLEYVKTRFEALCDKKYRKGAEEHKGDLFEVDSLTLVDYAIDEAVDQVVYLLTLKRRMLDANQRW